MKYYLLGALIVYPAAYLWGIYDSLTSGGYELQLLIMFVYAISGLLVLSAYFRKKTHFLLSRICIYVFAIMLAWLALAIFVRLTHFV